MMKRMFDIEENKTKELNVISSPVNPDTLYDDSLIKVL